MKRLVTFLLAVALCLSGTLPAYAKAKKAKLNPEARAALKRNKAVQKKMQKMAKSRNRKIKALRAAR